jgi:hypothetical protein
METPKIITHPKYGDPSQGAPLYMVGWTEKKKANPQTYYTGWLSRDTAEKMAHDRNGWLIIGYFKP